MRKIYFIWAKSLHQKYTWCAYSTVCFTLFCCLCCNWSAMTYFLILYLCMVFLKAWENTQWRLIETLTTVICSLFPFATPLTSTFPSALCRQYATHNTVWLSFSPLIMIREMSLNQPRIPCRIRNLATPFHSLPSYMSTKQAINHLFPKLSLANFICRVLYIIANPTIYKCNFNHKMPQGLIPFFIFPCKWVS